MRVAILAHEQFPDRAKTALGVLRYSSYDVRAVLDREQAGNRVHDFVPDVQDAPIVENMDEAPDVDALIIGIAPIGGGFDPSWRSDVTTALRNGCDIVSGLHYFLSEDDQFSDLASEYGCELRDVRQPPEDLTVAEGIAGDFDVHTILTVGTDCSVGKMTSTMEIAEALDSNGHDVGVIPTGQTGIMIEGWGISVDRVISDFTNGAVERMIKQKADEHDVLVVEGQGTIVHPAYSAVTCGILHGAMPDSLVLCHDADRETIHGYDQFSLPELETYVDLYESLAEPVSSADVVAGMLNTHGMESDDQARQAVDAYSDTIGVPATDPVRFSAEEIVEALIH